MHVLFGPFQLDLEGCELTRDGRPVALERRPTELLCLLAARPGELVMRRELAQHIWGGASGVDADMGINTAIGKIRRALDDSPASPRLVETVQGRGYRFIAELRQAAAFPTIAVVAFHAGRFDEAAGFARAAIALDSRFWIGHLQLAQAAEQLGAAEDALASLAQASVACGDSSKPAALRGFILARLGRRDEDAAELATLEDAARTRFVPPCARALINAGLGEADAAFYALDQAVAVREVNLAFLPVDAKWRTLRADPRWGAVLARCGFAGIEVAN